MDSKECWRCHGPTLERARPRGIYQKLASLIGLKVWRCRRCGRYKLSWESE